DDAAAVGQVRERGLGGGDGGAQVHLVELVPGVELAALHLFPGETAGDVHQAVQAAKVLGDAGQRFVGRRTVAQFDAAVQVGGAQGLRVARRLGQVDGGDGGAA